MNTPVTIITTGRVTADLELKTSQNGKNTKYVQFGLAVNKGYGEKEHPNFYNCLLYGEDAQRIIDAKVKKGSLIQIIGDQELVEYNRPKEETANTAGADAESTAAEEGFLPAEDCGENGLPFN